MRHRGLEIIKVVPGIGTALHVLELRVIQQAIRGRHIRISRTRLRHRLNGLRREGGLAIRSTAGLLFRVEIRARGVTRLHPVPVAVRAARTLLAPAPVALVRGVVAVPARGRYVAHTCRGASVRVLLLRALGGHDRACSAVVVLGAHRDQFTRHAETTRHGTALQQVFRLARLSAFWTTHTSSCHQATGRHVRTVHIAPEFFQGALRACAVPFAIETVGAPLALVLEKPPAPQFVTRLLRVRPRILGRNALHRSLSTQRRRPRARGTLGGSARDGVVVGRTRRAASRAQRVRVAATRLTAATGHRAGLLAGTARRTRGLSRARRVRVHSARHARARDRVVANRTGYTLASVLSLVPRIAGTAAPKPNRLTGRRLIHIRPASFFALAPRGVRIRPRAAGGAAAANRHQITIHLGDKRGGSIVNGTQASSGG